MTRPRSPNGSRSMQIVTVGRRNGDDGHEYEAQGCRNLAARILWDMVVDYVRQVGPKYEETAEELYSPYAEFLFESLQIDVDAALDGINRQRWEFQRLVALAYLDLRYADELQDWWEDFYGSGWVRGG